MIVAVALAAVAPLAPRASAAQGTVRVPAGDVRRPAARPRAPRRPPAATGWGDPSTWDTRVVRRVDREAPARVLLAGDSATLPTPTVPGALPDSLRRLGVRWASDSAALVGVDQEGRLVARRPGRTVVRAWTVAGTTSTPVVVRPAVRGVVAAVHEGELAGVAAPTPPLLVTVAGTAADGRPWRDSTRADAAGRFLLPLPPGAPADARWTVAIAAIGESAAEHHPATFADLPTDAAHRLTVALLPTTWRIGGGTPRPVDPARPAAPGPAGARFWRLVGPLAAGARAADGAPRQGTPVGWDLPLPLRVALAPADDDPPARTALAAHLAALATAWGATGTPGAPPPPFRLAPADSADVVVRVAPGIAEAGLTDASASGDGLMSAALVSLRGRATLRDTRVVQHELLHALGLGHTTAWPSVLAPVGAGGAHAATPADVVHAQLLVAIRRVGVRLGGAPMVSAH